MMLYAIPSYVSGASGNWSSVIRWDGNGLSEVGTTNRSNTAKFRLIVMRANHSIIGEKVTMIGMNRSNSHQAWGQPGLDRYGLIQTTSPRHDPWFKS